jgi:transposase
MNYSAIDLHSNNCVITVTDEADRVLAERRLPNELRRILDYLAPYKADLSGVAVESTYNWYWLVDGLEAAGFRVLLVNTTAVKKYTGLKHGDDESDARFLAHLFRLGILPTGTILPREQRAIRDVARKRLQLVRSRSSHILAVENIMARQWGSRLTSNQIKRLTGSDVDAMPLPGDVALAMKANIGVIAALGEQIDMLELRLQQYVGARKDYALLTSVPGIGRALATTILLETGPIERFAGVGNYASYARCVDSEYTSNGKRKGAGNTRNGNKYLAWAYIEAANFALRYCAAAKRFHDKKKNQTNPIVARKALAHKLARACFHILKEQLPFDITRCFA